MSESRDRLIDALLHQRFRENADTMDRRCRKAFAELDRARASDRASNAATVARFPARRALALARAALIAIAAGILIVLIPAETRAASLLGATLDAEARAARAQDDRRYAIEVLLPVRPDPFGPPPAPDGAGKFRPPPRPSAPNAPNAPTLVGTYDIRGSESRLDLTAPGLGTLTRAMSREGAWERDPLGRVRSLDPQSIWPRWIRDRRGEVAIERMDELLRLVQRSYVVILARGGAESPPHLRGALHLLAEREADVLGPEAIDLWIDTDRNVVLEARLNWRPPPARRPLPRPGAAEGTRRAPRDAAAGPAGTHDGPDAEMRYQAAPGALPALPPLELRLRRIDAIAFEASHFSKPPS